MILFISYLRVQQQVGNKKHQKYNNGMADNSTTWLSNTWLCRLPAWHWLILLQFMYVNTLSTDVIIRFNVIFVAFSNNLFT